ncbi:MarR family winged helix-turn-helix transcriptional regulator [Nakamurella deserti]|uniref:MarR family winged helix-turn-helix transcriptional regulator n=1 Tax=Nakamurella deserti TaxID=2164074 RepID=UPI0013005E23|nr:MarR family transcriptional regulator [Nakamurella deserti]
MAGETGLDLRQTQAISYLHTRGPMGQSDLAEALGLNTGSVTSLVDRLEAHSIAQRTPHPTDRRRFVVELTRGGREIADRSTDFMLGAFADIPPRRLGELADALVLLATGLRRHIDGGAAGS